MISITISHDIICNIVFERGMVINNFMIKHLMYNNIIIKSTYNKKPQLSVEMRL